MQLGICADTATLALLSPAPGIDFIEGFTQELLQSETSDATRTKPAEALLAQGFSLPASNRFLPADLKVVGPMWISPASTVSPRPRFAGPKKST